MHHRRHRRLSSALSERTADKEKMKNHRETSLSFY